MSEFGDSLCNDSDFEEDGESCAGASPPMESVDTTEEQPFEDARESEAESVCPDAEVLPDDGDGALRDWQRHWQRLLGFASEKTMPFDEVPEVLMQVCASVPAKFAELFGELAGSVVPGLEDSERGPTTSGPKRQRDLLPLPSTTLSAEDMPSVNSMTEGRPGRLQARNAWLCVMVATLNFHFCLGGQGKHTRKHHGPVTLAQRAAHIRLAVAADSLVDRVPGDMVLKHWGEEL